MAIWQIGSCPRRRILPRRTWSRSRPIMGRRTLPVGLKLVRSAQNPWYEVKLFEGRNNQIRLMFKHFGKLVEKLRRIRIGPLDLGSLKPGEFRHLSDEEVG